MALRHIILAFEIKLESPLRKLILIKLADNANEDGICWPSINHIAEQCECSRSTVIRHLKWLEDNGHASVTRSKTSSNKNKSNVYKLNLGSITVTPPSVRVTPPTSVTVTPESTTIESTKESRGRFTPPTVDEVRKRCEEKGYESVDPEYFVDFYTSKNWMVGKNKMSNWHASLAGWHSRNKKDEPNKPRDVSSVSHQSFDLIQKKAEEMDLVAARKAGFDSVEEHEEFMFRKTMEGLKKPDHGVSGL